MSQIIRDTYSSLSIDSGNEYLGPLVGHQGGEGAEAVLIFNIWLQDLSSKLEVKAHLGDEAHYFGFTPEDWYRAFCRIRYYWRERTREGQEGDGTSKKQNITAERPVFFDEQQLRTYRQNPRDALREPDTSAELDSETIFLRSVLMIIIRISKAEREWLGALARLLWRGQNI